MHSFRLLSIAAVLALVSLPAIAALPATPADTSGADGVRVIEVKRQAVRDQLIEMGVSAADSRRRVERLSDAEVEQLHAKMNDLPAGGRVGTTELLLIIIILILLL